MIATRQKCKCGHEWIAVVYGRWVTHVICPKCLKMHEIKYGEKNGD